MLYKYIKPYLAQILLVICLIFVQAMAELSLPDYMSKIVNVGIGQSGIEYAVPEVISAEHMEQLFPTEHPIYSYYQAVKPDAAPSSGSNLPREAAGTYELKNNTIETKTQVEPLFTTGFDNGNGDSKSKAIAFIVDEYQHLGLETSNTQTSFMFKSGTTMILITIASAAAAIFASFNSTRVAAGFARDLRKAVFTKVVSFSNKEFDNFSTASLITRSTNDVQQLQQFIAMGLRIIIFAPVMGIGAIIKILQAESSMAWILVVAVVTIMVIVVILFGATSSKFKKIQTLTDRVNMVVREALSGMLVIRAFSNQDQSEKRFDDVNKELTATNRFVTRTMGSMMPVMNLILNLCTVAIIFFGARYVDAGFIQVGGIMAFIQYAMHVIMSFLFVSMISIILPRAMVSLGRIKEVLESDVSILDAENPKEFDKNVKGYLEFKNVSFQYPDADECVINNISFTAKPGETTAFIGTTGSGKSTIVNLIPRLYDATQGEILIDNQNVKHVRLTDLRKKISYAPQKGILFSGTIESNIKFAGEHLVSDEQMLMAAETAQAVDFISQKPEKYNDSIAQGGANVSGGQRQRLSIARALAKPAEILIFDDSFSALDYKTDAMLRQSLKERLSDKTIIIVAQRIATIRNAEKIIVLDNGEIVGEGTHETLMETCEVYSQIATSQIG